jgi:hypothetical protein
MTVAVRPAEAIAVPAERRRLPRTRPSYTVSFQVGGAEGTFTAGAHLDGQLGEIFLRLGKQGSTLAGLAEAFSIVTSMPHASGRTPRQDSTSSPIWRSSFASTSPTQRISTSAHDAPGTTRTGQQ